jgi:hypothetical protein
MPILLIQSRCFVIFGGFLGILFCYFTEKKAKIGKKVAKKG